MSRVLAISDDFEMRQTLVSMLSTEFWMFMPRCVDSSAAMTEIARLRPRMVVIQAELRHRNGLDLAAEILRLYDPAIVVVANNDSLAARAFDVGVADYVVSPLRRERFAKAIQRGIARRALSADAGTATDAPPSSSDKNPSAGSKLRVKSKGGFIFLKFEELVWIEAAGNYLNLHCLDRVYRVREPLSDFYARLNGSKFVRIHRSIIVNTGHIRELRSWGMGDYVVVLGNSKELPVSRSFRDALDRWMSNSEFNSAAETAVDGDSEECSIFDSQSEDPPKAMLA